MKIYAIINIMPTGGVPEFKLTKETPNPEEITRGEGSCLVFELKEADTHSNFNMEELLEAYSKFKPLT
jgi:hypothetical protein